MPIISVEAYKGAGTRFYWDAQAEANINASDRLVIIGGNRPFLTSFAKQMVYLASNDFCLPVGTHLHYDQSFGHHYAGPELVLELMPAMSQEIELDITEPLSVCINLPVDKDQLHQCWSRNAKIVVTKTDSVHILANYQGLMFMATVLLFLIGNSANETTYICDKMLLTGWVGCDLVFKFHP